MSNTDQYKFERTFYWLCFFSAYMFQRQIRHISLVDKSKFGGDFCFVIQSLFFSLSFKKKRSLGLEI